jgi:hypothetical protein
MTDVAVIHASVSALHRNNSGLTPSHGGGMRLERAPPKPTLKRKLVALSKAWFDSLWYTLVVAAAIVYVMFGNDIRLAVAPKSADPAFFALTCIALVIFVVDMIVCSTVSRVRVSCRGAVPSCVPRMRGPSRGPCVVVAGCLTP